MNWDEQDCSFLWIFDNIHIHILIKLKIFCSSQHISLKDQKKRICVCVCVCERQKLRQKWKVVWWNVWTRRRCTNMSQFVLDEEKAIILYTHTHTQNIIIHYIVLCLFFSISCFLNKRRWNVEKVRGKGCSLLRTTTI